MKRNGIKRCNAGFFTLLGLVLTLAIICILIYIAFRVYFGKSLPEEEMDKSLSEQGIDTSSYQSILDSTRKKVKDINQQLLNRRKQLQDLK